MNSLKYNDSEEKNCDAQVKVIIRSSENVIETVCKNGGYIFENVLPGNYSIT